MQYFILFYAGVGGDGFANLLEHADNIYPADGNLTWRIHKIFHNKVKFFGVPWFNDPIPFRNDNKNTNIKIHDNYLHLINSNINTVIPCHYNYFQEIKSHPYKHIIEKNKILINLYSDDIFEVCENLIIKNELKIQNSKFLQKQTQNIIDKYKNKKEFFIHINHRKVLESYDYLKNKLTELNINLQKKYYDEYLKIINYNGPINGDESIPSPCDFIKQADVTQW